MAQRYCKQCKQTKTLEEFSKNRNEPSGHNFECKECGRRRRAEYRKRPGYNEQKRQYRKKYPEKPRARNHQFAASGAVQRAIKKGILPHISKCRCAKCRQPATDYHHYKGYEPEHRLDVVPLCRKCHSAAHNRK